MNVRTFPFPQGGNRGQRGFCRWCGEAVLTAEGLVNFRASWHTGRHAGEPDCLHTYYLHTRRDVQYAFLVERDGEKCADCGSSALTVRQPYGPRVFTPHRLGLAQPDGPYCIVEFRAALEVEHDTPLWLVAHLPDDERRRFFGPEQIRLRCVPCHQAKTSAEAGVRAKGNRLRKGPRKSKRPLRSGRKLQSRGFSKEHRPLRPA